MADEKKKDEAVADDESTTTKKRGEKLYTAEDMENLTEFMRMQPQSAYWTDPRQRYPYYAQTTVPERQKAAGTALGIGVGGAVAQRAIQASAMFDPALDYARRQLAEAEATQKRPLKGMSPEKADAIRAAARAGVQTEIAETKSDLGSLMASSQQAPSVQDILAVRETGQDAQVSAAIEAEAIIAKSDLATMEAQQRQADQAKLRADEMQSTLYKARSEQRGYTADLIGDVVRVGAEYAANAPAASETPVVDQLRDKGMSMDDIGELHKAAMANGFYPGSQAYRNYMMSHYEGATGKDPDDAKADRAPDVAGAPVTSTFAQSAADQLRQAAVPEGATPRPGLTEEQRAEMFGTLGQTPAGTPAAPAAPMRPPVPPTPPEGSTVGIAEQFATGGEPPGEGHITGMMEQPPQAAAIAKIGEGFSAGETADLYSLADEAGLKRDQYSIEEIQGMEHKDGPLYRIKLNEGVRLPEAAPTPSAAAPAAPINNLTTKTIPEYQALDDQLEEFELKLLKRGKVPENDPRYTRLALSVRNAETRMRVEAIRSDQNIDDLLRPRLRSEAWVARATAIDAARKAQEDNPAFGSSKTVYDLIRGNPAIAVGTDTVVFDKEKGRYFAVKASIGSDLIKNPRYKKVPIDRYLRGVK